MASTDRAALTDLVARALSEDLGKGDVTAEAVIEEGAEARAGIVQKQPGVLYGLEVAAEVFRQAGAAGYEGAAAEGQWREEVPATVVRVSGPARALLAAERTALNFLCHLSGVATLDRALRQGGGGKRRPDPRHPQDHARPADAGEGSGCGRRRHQPPDAASTTRS